MTTFSLSSCSAGSEPDGPIHKEEDPSKDPDQNAGSLTLIYAVASNNLERYLRSDTLEMIKAAPQIDLDRNIVLLYSITRRQTPTLKRLQKVGGDYHFVTVSDYDNSRYSTDPKRINEVISDVLMEYDAKSKGLVFWSHAWGWTYAGSSHVKPSRAYDTIQYAYGQDNTDGTDDRCDIDELARAVPDNIFDYIWFDCCYMGSVEVAYEMRNKTPLFIGYPTEIGAQGMPYDLTLPYLASEKPEIVKAANELFDYYNNSIPVTVAVCRTEGLEALAKAYRGGADCNPSNISNVHNYGRLSYGPFYDLWQLAFEQHSFSPSSFSLVGFKNALDNVIIYKAASEYDFADHKIDRERYSGLTVHLFSDDKSLASEFYKRLEWYKATRREPADDSGVPVVGVR